MGGRKRVRRILQHRHRHASGFGQFLHRTDHPLLHHAAAHHKQRTFGLADERPCRIELCRVAHGGHRGAVGGRRGGFRFDLLQHHFVGRFEMRRPLRFGQRHAKRLAHHFLYALRIWNAVSPFGNRAHERNLVEILRGIALAHFTFLHAANTDQRHMALVGRSNRRHQIGETRPFGGRHHGGRIARARKTVSHECRTLLVARENEADLGRLAQHVKKREILRTRNAEHMINPFAQQSINQRARSGYGADRGAFRSIHYNTPFIKLSIKTNAYTAFHSSAHATWRCA